MSEKASDDSLYPLDPIPFEVFHEGSWHAADVISIQDGNISVRKIPKPTMMVNIHTDFLRMRSRKATAFDCCTFLKPGIDVCVLLSRPGASSSESQSQQFAWLDARIIKIKKSHADTCNCLFAVMPYKSDGLNHMRMLVADHARITLVKITQIAILQKLKDKSDEIGNISACSTQNGTSVYKTMLFNYNNFHSSIATLLVLSTLCSVIEVKVVQGRIIYHVQENDVSQTCSTVNMKVVNFVNSNGVMKPKVMRLSIEDMCTDDKKASTGGIEGSLVVSNADTVYEELNIRRSKRLKFQPTFFSSYTTPNFGQSSHSPSAKGFSTSKSQPKNKLVKEEVTFQSKHAENVAYVKDEPQEKAVKKERSYLSHDKHKVEVKEHLCTEECSEVVEKLVRDLEKSKEGYLYRLHEKYGAKVKYFSIKEDDDLIDQLIKDQARHHKKTGWPYQRHGAKIKHSSTKECDDFIEELMTDFRCCMNRKAKPSFQQEEEACASASGYYPIEEDFTWPPTDSDNEIDKEKEKDEYDELWEDMDYCLNILAFEEEKKNFDSRDEVDSGKDEEELCVHDSVLNEQLGYICTKCNVVIMEIKDIFPPMMKERSYQIPKDRAHLDSNLHPFNLDPSFFKTSPNSNQSKSSRNIWTPILYIEPKLNPHQRKAFEFIWMNMVSSLELGKLSSINGNTGGCVLSHSPGSGKTLTVISFLISYLAVFPHGCPLVLTPKSAVHTWENEFKKWDIKVPVHVIHRDIAYQRRKSVGKMKNYMDYHCRPSSKAIRIMDSLEKVRLWHENPGVLLMTYSSFFSLMKDGSRDEYYEFMANVLQTSPGLLVLDEGHNPRSNSSKLRRLLMKVNTQSRILLSGTVFQNNFEEYFNTLCLARPCFMRDVITKLEVKNRARETTRGRKRKNEERRAQKLFVEEIGHKIESNDRWDRKQGFELLRKMTSGFINTFDGDKLLNLPDLETYTIFLQCTEPQENVLRRLQNPFKTRSCYSLELEFLASVGTIHPCLVSMCNAAKRFFTDEELKEISGKTNFSRGSKTSFVIDLILKSLIRKEWVLVFCHNLEPLKLLIKMIEYTFEWNEGKEILFLNGDQDLSVRYDIIDRFNKKGDVKVLLASTNACAEGISLTAASRIVFLDSEWNPSKTKQAIARAYRLGQDKKVFVYLLVISGSWEESKYESNKKKAQLSKMVLSGKYIEDSNSKVVSGGDITDELLREIVEEDNKINMTVKMVVKQ